MVKVERKTFKHVAVAGSFVFAALVSTQPNPVAYAQSPAGTWQRAAPLDNCLPASRACTGRQRHAATLLKNGKVLVAGGGGSKGEGVGSAQLYDPAKNSWTATAPPTKLLVAPTATLLHDGRVLSVSGQSAELYDPGRGEWVPVPVLPSGHGEHTASLLPDGKVLIAGGTGAGTGTAAADVYDPAANTWAAARPLGEVRYGHSAASLKDGRVLVVGGFSQDYGPKRSTAELYDPARRTWAPAAPLKPGYSPAAATATVLPDGKVLLAGGQSASQDPGGEGGDRTAQIYDPAANAWTDAAMMNAGRSLHTATLLENGKVLVVGGTRTVQFGRRAAEQAPAGQGAENVGPPPRETAEIYDPASNTWTPVPASRPRSGHTATLLLADPRTACGGNCGKVLVTGGATVGKTDNRGNVAADAGLFRPADLATGEGPGGAPGGRRPGDRTEPAAGAGPVAEGGNRGAGDAVQGEGADNTDSRSAAGRARELRGSGFNLIAAALALAVVLGAAFIYVRRRRRDRDRQGA